MTADRVFAIWKPFRYRNINHKMHFFTAITTCAFISISTSICEIFILEVANTSDGYYQLLFNNKYLNSLYGNLLTQLRNLVRIIGVATLIFFNVVLIILFKKSNQKVFQMTQNEDNAIRRKNNEKTLALLAILQAIVHCFFGLATIMLYACLYSIPGFIDCEGHLLFILLDALWQLLRVIECYSVFFISKQARKIIKDTIGSWKCC